MSIAWSQTLGSEVTWGLWESHRPLLCSAVRFGRGHRRFTKGSPYRLSPSENDVIVTNGHAAVAMTSIGCSGVGGELMS